MAKLLTHDEVIQGDRYPMLIERTILQRVPEGKEIDPEEYEHLLLDGVSCPFIFDSDKIFMEKFTSVTSISMNSCTLKNLENFPYMEKVIKIEL